MTKQLALRLLVIAVFLAALAAFFALDLGQYFNLETLRVQRDRLLGFTEQNLALVLSGFMLIYILMAALSLPGAAVLTIAGGALFGVALGTVAVSFASSIGATLVFLAARFLFRDAIQKRFGRRLKAINEGVKRDGAFYLLALRLVPAFPFWVINLVMALTPIRTWTYYWVSQLGMLPATVVYVNAGTQLAQIESTGDILSPGLIGAFALLGLLPLLLRWFLRLLRYRKVYRDFAKPARFDYNLVVIGAGAAGLVSAYIGATVKAKVALIEKNKMGGDCLNTGCVPSKALIRTARLMAEARASQRYGIHHMSAEFDFAQAMARVRRIIAKIEPHDSPERYRAMGVDVIEGTAKLVSPWEVEVDGRRLSARAIVLATGAEPLVPPLPGLADSGYLTSDTLWDLETLPERLVVLGGGPIGCELAQAFARLGSKVTVVEMSDRLLPREDSDAGSLLTQHLVEEGVTVATSHQALRVDNARTLVCRHEQSEVRLEFDRLLVALGRKPRTEGYGLDQLGVQLTEQGRIDTDRLQATNFPNVYVCGDAAGPYQFTHVAAHQAWTAAVNALIRPFWSFRTDYRVIPWVTFTDPEVARVGLNEQEAREREIDVEVTTYRLDDLDRAIAESEDYGWVKVLTEPGKDRILGATLVGSRAGEMLAEFVLAMKHGLGLNKILGTIHVYPTWAEANKFAAGEWKKAHQPETALRWARRFFAWRRGRADSDR
ncbi:MAG: FAD-dependent oxidoreductase [Wenzhouxiangella sp.]